MKKLEDVLDRYSWLFKLGVVLLWIFWAAQLADPVINHLRVSVPSGLKDMESRGEHFDEFRKNSIELMSFIGERIAEAKKQQDSYGPREYYRDYKAIEEKKSANKYLEEPPFFFSHISELQAVMMDNIHRGRFAYGDIDKVREENKEWLDKILYEKHGPGYEIFEEIEKIGLGDLLRWFGIFYLRSMLLAALLYLVRMAQHKGILGTILADKRKFFLALTA